MVKTTQGSKMKLENATGGGWSFRQVGHFDGTRSRENGRHACWIIHGRGNMPVTSPPPICIGEYLASEIYPNHDLEFRRPAIDQPIRRIDIPRWQMWRRSRIQRSSVFIRARNVLLLFPRSMQRFFSRRTEVCEICERLVRRNFTCGNTLFFLFLSIKIK